MSVIRRFTFSDIESLSKLMEELGYPTTSEAMLLRMENIESDPMCCTYVAEHENTVVGMVGVRKLFSYEGDNVVAQIAALVTHSELRGQGIGKELVKQAEKWAKEQGAYGIFLTSGNKPERENAHQFYKHLGYNHTGSRFSKGL